MSQSSFPTSTSGVFIPSLWETAGGGGDLTRAQADARYLKFPTGQGTETIPALVVSGQATIDSIVIKQPTGTNNNVVGKNTLNNTTSASYDNFAFGANTATGVLTGNNNTFIGNAGFGAITSASNTTSVGANNGIALTTGSNNTFLGKDTGLTLSTGSNNIFIGSGADTTLNTASQSTALGYLSSVGGNNATALGHGTNASANNSTAIGHNAASSGVQSIAIGYNVVSNSTGSVSMGASSVAGGASAIAIGASSIANGDNSTAIGASATCGTFTKSTAIGKDATATANNQVVLGTSSESVIIPRNIRYLNSPMVAWGINGGSQSIPTTSDVTINYNVADARNGSYTGITNSSGTFTNSNSYSVTLSVSVCLNFSNNSSGFRVMTINLGGVKLYATSVTAPVIGDVTNMNMSSVFVLNSGESFFINSFQNSGSTLTAINSGDKCSRISMLVM